MRACRTNARIMRKQAHTEASMSMGSAGSCRSGRMVTPTGDVTMASEAKRIRCLDLVPPKPLSQWARPILTPFHRPHADLAGLTFVIGPRRVSVIQYCGLSSATRKIFFGGGGGRPVRFSATIASESGRPRTATGSLMPHHNRIIASRMGEPTPPVRPVQLHQRSHAGFAVVEASGRGGDEAVA